MEKSKEKLMKLSKEELIDKLWNERIANRDRYDRMLAQKDQEARAAVASLRNVCDQVICRLVRSYGHEDGDEYILEIPIPDCPDGKFWGTKIEVVGDDKWRIHSKLFDIPEFKGAFEGRQTGESVKKSQKTKEERAK